MASKVGDSFKLMVTLGLLVQTEAGAVGGNCTNLQDTKNKMYAVMRAYQCENSSNLDDCREHLGVGRLGAYALGAGAAGAMGKKIASRFQNSNFVICPIGAGKGAQRFPIGELMLPSAWAACTSAEPLLKAELKEQLNADIAELDKRIAAQETEIKKLEEPEAVKAKAPGDDLVEQNRQKLQESQELVAKRNNSLKETLAKLNPEVREEVSRRLEEIRSQSLATKGEAFDRLASSDRALKEYLGYHRNLTLAEKTELGRINFLLVKAEMGEQYYGETLRASPSKTSAVAPAVKKDSALLEQMKSNLNELRQGKQRLENIVSQKLSSTSLASNLDHIKSAIDGATESNAISAATKNKLIGMDSRIASLEFKAPQNPYGARNVRSVPVRSANLKTFAARLMGGVVLSTGVMTAASAAEVEDFVENGMDAVSGPFALLHAENLGGNCGDTVPSPHFPFKEGCGYNLDWNENIQRVASEASDEQLGELFKGRGVCDAIQANYQKYYPKPRGAVNCNNSPTHVELTDGSSFTFNDDYLSTQGLKNERVGYFPDKNGLGHFSTGDKGAKESLLPQDFNKKYPEKMASFSRLKPLAMSIQACCSQTGMMPSQEECQYYGIQTSSPGSSGEGTGNR